MKKLHLVFGNLAAVLFAGAGVPAASGPDNSAILALVSPATFLGSGSAGASLLAQDESDRAIAPTGMVVASAANSAAGQFNLSGLFEVERGSAEASGLSTGLSLFAAMGAIGFVMSRRVR